MIDSVEHGIVGVGFGPANLALCVALQDSHSRLKHVFFEQKPEFSWHLGMQMDGVTMQTAFLEDLVTRHDPRSKFTFLNYLKLKGRLTEFADLRDFFPSRYEFNDYFRWAANQVRQCVRYNTTVTSIVPVVGDKPGVEALDVCVRDTRSGSRETVRTQNVVLGLGYTPVMPKTVGELEPNGRVFHSITTLPSLQGRFASREAPYSFMVTGAGQSAAEITLHLLRQYPNARVTVVSRGFVFRAKDSNAFVSAFFTGDAADAFFDLDESSRGILLSTLDETNYSAADTDLLAELAKVVYADRVRGMRRLDLRSFCELREVEETSSMVRATCWSQLSNHEETIDVDGVCLATGFSDEALKGALNGVDGYLKRDESGAYRISREYRVETETGFLPGIYVQGYARNFHGCTEGTISDLPHRAHRILESVYHRRYDGVERRVSAAVTVA
jgi:L-ornithine N5-monooxygenase